MLNRLRRLLASLRKHGELDDLALLDEIETAINALAADPHGAKREAERLAQGRRTDFDTRSRHDQQAA